MGFYTLRVCGIGMLWAGPMLGSDSGDATAECIGSGRGKTAAEIGQPGLVHRAVFVVVVGHERHLAAGVESRNGKVEPVGDDPPSVLAGFAGVIGGTLAGMEVGGAMILGVLCASASYIAAPAAVRLALPEAKPSITLASSLGMTFPFNLIVGIPVYLLMAEAVGSWWG